MPTRHSPLPSLLLATACTVLAPTVLQAQAEAPTLTPAAAIELAFASNPDARVAALNVEQARTQVQAAEGARVPTVVANVGAAYNERFTGTGGGITRNSTRSLNGGAGLRYTTDWGTALSVDVSTSRQWQTINVNNASNSNVDIGPNDQVSATLSVRQPLLRGAGTDGQLGNVAAASASLSQAERTREATASQLMRDTLSAYWELWYAERALALQRQALVVAEQQLRDTSVRVEQLGTAARTDVYRFATERASILEAIASAEATRRTRAFELGRLIGMQPEAAAALTLVEDGPAAEAPVALEVATQAALRQSPDLLALEQQIQAAEARLQSARDAAQTKLDVVTSLGANGLWSADDMLRGLDLPGGRPAFVGTVGLELELPVGDNQASGNFASALASKSQAEAQHEARQAQVRTEVATAHETLTSARLRMGLSQESVDNARAVVEGEQHRLSLGTATSSEVIVAQQTYRETELRRLRTTVDAALASVRLRQVTGQLLADNRALAARMGQ